MELLEEAFVLGVGVGVSTGWQSMLEGFWHVEALEGLMVLEGLLSWFSGTREELMGELVEGFILELLEVLGMVKGSEKELLLVECFFFGTVLE